MALGMCVCMDLGLFCLNFEGCADTMPGEHGLALCVLVDFGTCERKVLCVCVCVCVFVRVCFIIDARQSFQHSG